ncbi:MAG: hypothetical protein QOF78_3888 [Phycisphaerales bacterium]|jgi:hypothetical protein|nr:hypothetical protein [Phycisphaerales bacterium]
MATARRFGFAFVTVISLAMFTVRADDVGAPSEEQLDSKLTLPAGSYVLRVSMNTDGEIRGGQRDLMGLKPPEPTHDEELVILQVQAHAPTPDGQLLTVQYRRARRLKDSVTLDSDRPQDHGELSQAYADLTSLPFTVVLDAATGRVNRVDGMEPVWQRIGRRNNIAEMQKRYGEARVKSCIDHIRGVLPPEPARIGQTWEQDRDRELIGAGKGRDTYTFAAIEDAPADASKRASAHAGAAAPAGRLAVVTVAGRHRGPVKNAKFAGIFEAQQKGTAKHDLTTGQVRFSTAQTNATSKVDTFDGKPLKDAIITIITARLEVRFAPGQYDPAAAAASTQPLVK